MAAKSSTSSKRLVRPKSGRVFGGVCLALANYLNVDVTIIRIIAMFLVIPGGLPGLVPYLVCLILIPSE
jgi:phage shock protein C